MKNKIPIILLALVSIIAVFYAYDQKKSHDVLRDANARLRNEIKQLKDQSVAARLEASKLRYILENEKKMAQAAMEAANNKNSQKKK